MRSKIMRKAIKGLLVISLVFALVFIFSLVDDAGTVSTKGSDDESDNIVFIADDEVTEDMIEVGEKYAKEMNSDSNGMSGVVWEMQSSTTVVSYRPIRAAFGDIVAIGETREEDYKWSVNAGTKIDNYPLSVSVSGSKSTTQNGPETNDKLADGKKASHRAFFLVGYGRLVKYTYKVTDKYSGRFLRNETRYMYSDVSTKLCNQLIQLNGTTVYAEDETSTKVKDAGTLVSYKNKFSDLDGICLAHYKWQ